MGKAAARDAIFLFHAELPNMEIARHKVVTIDYTLTDHAGTVIDSTDGGDPFSYLHGAGTAIPGLENALDGKAAGEALSVQLSPERAYGERNEALVQVVSREQFESDSEVEVGMQFQATTEAGPRLVTVVKVVGEEVTVDGNHPLAGVTLKFDVNVRDVRDATAEEVSHGHPHGPGTHGH